MVNLNAHVPGRMRPVERAHFHAFHPIQHPGCSGFQTQVDFPQRQLRQHGETGIQIIQLFLQYVIHIGSQRRRIESGNENGFRRLSRIGDDSVRTLNDHRPQTGTQQRRSDVFLVGGLFGGNLERLVNLFGGRSDHHVEDLTLIPAVYGGHLPADRRGEQHLRTVLVVKQRRSGLHDVVHPNQHLRDDPLEIVRFQRIGMYQRQPGQLASGFPLQPDIKAFFQLYDLRHIR